MVTVLYVRLLYLKVLWTKQHKNKFLLHKFIILERKETTFNTMKKKKKNRIIDLYHFLNPQRFKANKNPLNKKKRKLLISNISSDKMYKLQRSSNAIHIYC